MKGATGLDLNLLLLLEALLAEGSVSGAARRLGISQPAASKALARLRRHFGDALFVRTPRGMRPTDRVIQLEAELKRVLADVRRLVEEAPVFDPSTAQGIVRLAMSDIAEFALLPGLIERLHHLAPQVDLRARPLDKTRAYAALDSGELDALVGVFPDLPKRFSRMVLWQERFVCLVRSGHPWLAQGATLAGYLSYPHILVTLKDDAEGAVDRALAALGLTRRVAATAGHFLSVPPILTHSDCVATVGSRFAQVLAEPMGCRICEPPLTVAGWTEQLVWGQGADRPPLQRWVRKQIAAAARSIGQAE
ncbi:LysR family transcriptional regulator [Gloeobacter morelensis]|uniref:LysR family transcriptional regulator n=1 Tax=Gloeobacter morelensis MG652769 TaxID=2781736 RepID=A0ABY3PSH4_9CYAN|nr:LysR family transcriptional regulator [Gloeobacter morelensis]UFP96661.1 LysR family transcriptional regulator [Gloeobacter morelensis MG652769]